MAKSKVGPLAILVKIGPKLGALGLKLLKGLKAGKVIFAVASLAAYSYLFTWQFAVLILFMLFVHESGHIWAMKKCGMKTKGIYFIPFLGAAAVTDEEFKSRNDESFIAIMGPIWGLALSLIALVVYDMTNNPFFAATASWFAMINLFNLIPINPLDGGRIAKSIAFSLHSRLGYLVMAVGLIATIILAIKVRFGLFLLLFVIGSLELFFEVLGNKRQKKKAERLAEMNCQGIERKYTKLLDEIDDGMIEIKKQAQINQMEQEKQACLKRLEDGEKDRVRTIPTMSARQIAYACIVLFLVAGSLLGVMVSMSHVPGAAAAMEILKDSP